MSNTAVHFSSVTNEWATPQDFFDKLDAEFHFTLDPCATPENAKCARYFTEKDDGLAQSWDGEVVFMNPPYGRAIGNWVKKASEAKATVVCLIPARTDTRYWHDYVIGGGAEVRFIRGRLKFGGSTNSAPFPSAVVIFKKGATMTADTTPQEELEPIRSSFPKINGIDCPACGFHGTLFLANGNYITCSILECPQPIYAEAIKSLIERKVLEGKIEAYADCGSKGGDLTEVGRYALVRAHDLTAQLNQLEGKPE